MSIDTPNTADWDDPTPCKEEQIEQEQVQIQQKVKEVFTPVPSFGEVLPAAGAMSVITAADILSASQAVLKARGRERDTPDGERSMDNTICMFNSLYNTALNEEQGWMLLALLKMVRSTRGEFSSDNYIDGINYIALAGEAAAKS